MKRTTGEKAFSVLNALIMIFFMITILYPFLNVMAIAFNDGADAMRGGITIFPRKFSMAAFERMFEKGSIGTGLKNSLLRTAIVSPLALLFTSGLAYILSHKDLLGRRVIMFLFIFTMYFGGGIVPNYLLMRDLKLLNTFAVYIIPGLLNVYNMMLMRAYFEELPSAVMESAEIDGASKPLTFFRIVLPMSKPVLATVFLFTAVAQWNNWYDTYVYTTDASLITLQGILINVIKEAQDAVYSANAHNAAASMVSLDVTPENVRDATIVIASFPIIVMYPFLQKYFVKGVVLGAVKG